MNTWLSFLGSHSGQFHDGDQISFGEQASDYESLAEQATFSPLLDRGVLSVSGADTDKLLQGQLTCDLSQLGVGGSLPGALCDNKGRVISTFLALRPDEQRVLLVMHKDIVSSTLETLKKYAVFYKTTLEDLSSDYRVFGLNNISDPGELFLYGGLTGQLGLGLVTASDALTAWGALANKYTAAGTGLWQYLAIRNGIGEVRPETQGEFIPQMLNLQHTGAVNFRKGCYTGQEIVARMQYLGKLKRRMYRLDIDSAAAIAPGTAIHRDGKSDVGTVVLSERSGPSSQSALAVLTAEAAQASSLIFGDIDAALQLQPLPYDDKFMDGTSPGANGA
ncbi:MAG: hypothetical protein WC997_08890 [Porticoccaceae bacterium]